jgi:hypothetical protein
MYNYQETLLSNGATNTKTAKNSLKTFILYIAPHTMNNKGVNLCPKASKGCVLACLYSSGRGKFSNVQNARINKANYYINDKMKFVNQLATEIRKKVKTARKTGEKIAFRLNGTSDVDFVYLLKKYAALDIETLKDVAKFYDYTKILGKAIKYIKHPNYTVTFSRAEDNQNDTMKALKMGANVAAVFANGLPQTYKGFKVVDGDKTDLEMLSYKNVILGLKAKGEAKNDTSGFVINAVY